MEGRLLWEQEVVGSTPTVSTHGELAKANAPTCNLSSSEELASEFRVKQQTMNLTIPGSNPGLPTILEW